MAIRTPVTTSGIYFITFTCHQWLPLIKLVNGYDLVYNWFDVLSEKGHTLTGYVIMPNHLHMLLHYSGIGHSLNTVVGNGKRFMGYDIIERLEQQRQNRLLRRLQKAVEPGDKKRGKKHELWEDSFDVKECRTERFVLQKLNYIHKNPCAGKWMLADSLINYWHSSASFYISGKTSGYPVRHYREFLSF
jgi:REP element-mobilizing transposase RayT